MRQSPIQRLRLPRPRLESLVGELDGEEMGHADGRAGIRRPCCRSGVLATREESRPITRHEVFVRNVSMTGSSVLHAVFLPTHAPCTLVLISDEREPVAVDATVVRCRHIEGPMHELGLLFIEELTESRAERLCVAPGAAIPSMGGESHRLRAALARCTELTEQVRQLIEDGADTDEVLPLLDELGSLESLTCRTA